MKTNRAKNWMAVYAALLTATVAQRATAEQPATAVRPEKNYSGTVVSINPQESTLKTRGFMFDKTFNLGASCACALLDNRPGTVYDLRPGEEIAVSYQIVNGVLVADSVKEQPLHCEGMAKAVDPEAHTLTVRIGGTDKTFQIADGCNFALRNDKSGSLAEIQAGNHVTVIYETPGGKPTAWQIAQTSSEFTGTLMAIDLEENTLKAKALFDTKKFNVGDDCSIVINGQPDGKLSDLKPEEKLVVSYDEVNGVNVANRIAPAEPESQKNSVASTPATTPGSSAPMTGF